MLRTKKHRIVANLSMLLAALTLACGGSPEGNPGPMDGGLPATGSGGLAATASGTSSSTGASGNSIATATGTSLGTMGSGGTSGGATTGSGGATTGSGGTTTGSGGGGEPDFPEARRRELFNGDWSFTKNDPAGADSLSYSQTKQWTLPTGNAFISNPANRSTRPEANLGDGIAYIAPEFDDSGWQAVTLPHDYAIEGPFTDDVSANMGHLVGGWPYGYSSFSVDITPYVNPGESNSIAVRVDNLNPTGTNWDQGTSRWYPGAGIYRDVWLVTTHQVHVTQWGTFVSIAQPLLWGPPPTQQPNLYAAVTFVSIGGEVVDVYRTNFGIRTLELSPDRGLIVNGEQIKVKGVCNHHDLGALGSAAYPRGKARQLEILAEMGANARAHGNRDSPDRQRRGPHAPNDDGHELRQSEHGLQTPCKPSV